MGRRLSLWPTLRRRRPGYRRLLDEVMPKEMDPFVRATRLRVALAVSKMRLLQTMRLQVLLPSPIWTSVAALAAVILIVLQWSGRSARANNGKRRASYGVRTLALDRATYS